MPKAAFAPAKVNLFLHVGPPAADGYHPICSLMVFADIGDVVMAYQAEALEVTVLGPFASALEGEGNNLVLRAARGLIAEARRPVAPFGISLDKRLPVAAGLGGGSSDAGATLRLLRELGLKAPEDRLEMVAESLGADGAACLWGRPVLAEGRGERLTPAPALPTLEAVLVNPRVPVQTGEVYKAYDASGAFGDVTPPPAPDRFEDVVELAAWLSMQRNDLEPAAIRVAPAVGDVLETLRGEPETLLARVSGSGGTCFALCRSDLEAETLAQRIEAMAPDWWVRRCRLGGPWPDPE
ncbi:4-(cytidine 5'-diphospho)-2-C-methyl-D-erythritol kinase [Phenylobacterium soli]|uniref:4-diphosphocytidyl-2-C-methyl-D-erythritol kinase n=1 Tax=Phenylobacterium soli TaxID=2170551 RepID=A0A328AMK9_9CAUL|nr:4-(cytidine 5'-diphospho)-2-C-methyl-D-erythritol kinase [Phenylobacterium soli]RAK55641.1 4-(cytidine 5'-diphospho)-2-C-methyl-D-erythritol kinase [Phenylobacterium soli]